MDEAIEIDVAGTEVVLEGAWHESRARAAVVAPPHPLYGGSLDNPVVVETAAGLADEGFSTLRFNWRGIGASRGRASGEIADADADYAAAVRWLEERRPEPFVAAGYSFGAAAAVRIAARNEHVRALLLVAPPLQMLDSGALAAFAGPVRVIVGERDDYAPLAGLEALLAKVGDGRLDVVMGADHFFAFTEAGEIRRLARAAVEPSSTDR